MSQISPMIVMLLVVLLAFYLITKFRKVGKVYTSQVSDMDQLMTLQFSLDHAVLTLNKIGHCHPFATTMSNHCADTNYYNFENAEMAMESIQAQLMASDADIDLVLIAVNDSENSRLEIQSFLKGKRTGQVYHKGYQMVDSKYVLDGQGLIPVKEQANLLYKK